MAAILEWLSTAAWPALRVALAQVVAFIAVNVATAPIKLAIGIAVMTAWGVFLAVVTTGFDGLGLWTLLNHNPLDGMAGDTYQLFCSVFPFQFFIRLAVGYILWCLSFQSAAWVMMKAIRVMFGG